MNTTTITLRKPAKKGEREIFELVFQEPEVGHMLATDKYDNNTYAADVALASALTGEPEEIIKKLSPEDWVEVRKHLAMVWARFYGIDPEKLKEKAEESGHPTKAGTETPRKSGKS